MSDNRYFRSKSPKRYKTEELLKSKMRKSKKHSRKEDSRHRLECKTPPLPSSSSLDELLKQRENLKEELDKITTQSKFDLEITHNLDDNRLTFYQKESQHSIKRSYVEDRDTHNTKKNRKEENEINIDHTLELNESHLDSDEEENIIKQRRKQRKELLEKLNSSCKTIDNVDHTGNKHDNESANNDSSDHNMIKSMSEKETTDMFSENDISIDRVDTVLQGNCNAELSDNWDDAEGYYNVRVGDMIDSNKYTVKSLLGQGVFANVILAQDNKSKTEVAIKIMRNNDVIYRTGLKELTLLKEINDADPENKHHCVKFFSHFMYKSHLCVVIEPLYMDMRKVIKKYGRHGLNMKAVMSYSRQLLLALRLLKKIGIIHADVKPDNMLVNEKKNILKLCDFGSASRLDENDITPYLVSRFYRAPEIILGLEYKHGIDIWSAACTMYEMATGKIMFTGSSNNKMLKCFMDLKGKIPNKLIRKGKFKDQHFNYNYNFLLHKKDEVSGREKFVEVSSINATRDILLELKKSHKNATPEVENKLTQLKDILEKMLMLDSTQRLSVSNCLKHPFIQESLRN